MMEYLVMECGYSYAVVMDSQGRFIKVPNLGYEVGQVVDFVVLPEPVRNRAAFRRKLVRFAAAAACLCLVAFGGWKIWQTPNGTVRLQINPDVQMEVNRFDRVVGLEGLNEDGEELIEGYRAYGRKVEAVSDDLADRAVALGYLEDGGKITLTVESDKEEWRIVTEEKILLELEVHLKDEIKVELEALKTGGQKQENSQGGNQGTANPGHSDYDDDDYDDDDDDPEDGDSGYGDDSHDDGITNYDDDSRDDGITNYEDGISSYDDDSEDDGITSYGENAYDDSDDDDSDSNYND